MIDRARLDMIIYSALRILAGAMLACHGVQKLFGLFGGHMAHVGSQMWIGGVIELVGGLLVAVGYHTRLAAFILSGQMAVAYFQFHVGSDLTKILPISNGGDDTVLYCFLFLLIWARGGGPYSLDGRGGTAPLP